MNSNLWNSFVGISICPQIQTYACISVLKYITNTQIKIYSEEEIPNIRNEA